MPGNDKTIIFTAYFNGTGHRADDPRHLASVLKSETQNDLSQSLLGSNQENETINIPEILSNNPNDVIQITECFDGCGVTYGFWGGICGTGIDKDCERVVDAINACLALGYKVIFNGYGHSRGAITALQIAQALGDNDPEQLEVNLAIFDVVPGNFLTMAQLDVFNWGLANQSYNLSNSRTLRNVLSVYAREPVPAVCHAPLFPIYPSSCNVEEIILGGCHSLTQYLNRNAINSSKRKKSGDENDDSEQSNNKKLYLMASDKNNFLLFLLTIQFLKECKTEFSPQFSAFELTKCKGELRYGIAAEDAPSINDTLLILYDHVLEQHNKAENPISKREAHAKPALAIMAQAEANYVNEHHHRLASANNKDDVEDIEDITPAPKYAFYLNRPRSANYVAGHSKFLTFFSPEPPSKQVLYTALAGSVLATVIGGVALALLLPSLPALGTIAIACLSAYLLGICSSAGLLAGAAVGKTLEAVSTNPTPAFSL